MENSILKDNNPVIQEIEEEIEDTKKKQKGELEIEIVDEEKPKEKDNVSHETKDLTYKDLKYSLDVQKIIKSRSIFGSAWYWERWSNSQSGICRLNLSS